MNLYLFLFICVILFILVIFLRKKVEHFSQDLYIKQKIDIQDSEEKKIRVKKLCIGDTCVDGGLLGNILNMFTKSTEIINEKSYDIRFRQKSACFDDVCLFPENISIFEKDQKGTEANKSVSNDLRDVFSEKINELNLFDNDHKKWNILGLLNNVAHAKAFYPKQKWDSGNDFKMALSNPNKEILKGFGTDLEKTKHLIPTYLAKDHPDAGTEILSLSSNYLSGKVCYSPYSRANINIYNEDTKHPPLVASGGWINDFVIYDHSKFDNNNNEPIKLSGVPHYDKCMDTWYYPNFNVAIIDESTVRGTGRGEKDLKDLQLTGKPGRVFIDNQDGTKTFQKRFHELNEETILSAPRKRRSDGNPFIDAKYFKFGEPRDFIEGSQTNNNVVTTQTTRHNIVNTSKAIKNNNVKTGRAFIS